MTEMLKRDERGFTLIELLIVIVIIGILAAVVVFAVSGITDRGQTTACSADLSALRTSLETVRASSLAAYGNEAYLKDNGFIGTKSTLYNVGVGANTAAAQTNAAVGTGDVTAASGAVYAILIQSSNCGTVGTFAT